MFKTIDDVTIEALKTRSTLIHYFGLGFIQIKLGPKFRMHFYTKDLPGIVDEEDVHNHRYDFKSNILAGELIQELFVRIDGDTHILKEESCQIENKHHNSGVKCGLMRVVECSLPVGSWYNLSKFTFHRVRASLNGCITLVERETVTREFADVVHKIGTIEVCPFSYKISETTLWEKVGAMLDVYKKSITS